MKPDIIVGGFPCQDLSLAGKRAGLKGARSGLFHEFIRIVRKLQPALAVIENVPGLVSSNSGRDFLIVLDSLVQCGALDISSRTLDSRYFNLAQRRARVFLVADFRKERAGEILFERPCGCGNSPKVKRARAQPAADAQGKPRSYGASDYKTGAYKEVSQGALTTGTDKARGSPLIDTHTATGMPRSERERGSL